MARNLELRQLLLQQMMSLNTTNNQSFQETQNYSLLLSILREIRALIERLSEDEPDPSSEVISRLQDLVGNEVEVATGFAPVSGILQTVETDYIVLLNGTSRYFVPLNAIEGISS